MHRTATVLSAILLLAAARALEAQGPPPDGPWRTFRTEHFRVTYQPDLEPLARQAAAVAEGTHRVLTRELAEPPEGLIDLVVSDHVDYANGFATPFPSNRIVVFARPGVKGDFFARDWMELVVAHEVVHIFHLDQSGLLGDAVRTVFGRVPWIWPIFSVGGTPAWSTEGLATYYETRLTGSGRVRASFHDMIIRTAALEDEIPGLDALSAPNPVWPAGNRSYVYGARLMQYVADQYGPEAHRTIVSATAGSILPTFLVFDPVSEEATGKPFDDLYDEWRAAARDTATAVARRVRAAGETTLEPVAGRGPYAVVPRVAPGGRRLSFAVSDWRSEPATRIVDLGTGEVRTVARRNEFGGILSPASWLPDGSGMIVAQLERQGPYRTFSDLWRVDLDGRETRLTEGLRLAQPDVAGDGRRVAAIQEHRGGLRLVVYDLETGDTRVVADATPGEAFDAPRWSPDGRQIAVAHYADGQMDLALVDPTTGGISGVTRDTPQDAGPAWSPDGAWLLWWSDRTGVPNIMAVAMEDGRPAGPVRQVTNVVTGVIDPEVSPDGTTLFVAAYHADGWGIERLAFEPGTWWDAPPPRIGYGPALLPPPGAAPAQQGGQPSSYSPLATLRPYYWAPWWETLGRGDAQLRFLGATVEGYDVLQRHVWALQLGMDTETGRLLGTGRWLYRGLGNPQLYLNASRDWAGAGSAVFADSTSEPVLLRDDQLEAGALFLHSRYRSTASLRVGMELERQRYEGRNLSAGDLEARGVALPDLPTLAGLTVGPGFRNYRAYPFSISPEDGINVGAGIGRWWVTETGDRGYDEVAGRAAGYLAFPLWGFANHVLAVRGRGLIRVGDEAPARSIGGVAGDGVVTAGTDFGSSYPVRGFDAGTRFGTRAWTASAEWRFPIHLRDAPGRLLGFSMVSLSGAVFADAGNAWCTEQDRARPDWDVCATAAVEPLVSAGAELSVNFGIYHNSPGRLVMGLAKPVSRPDSPVFYLGIAL